MHDKVDQREVIVERQGSAGIIRLNRPRALNSLTLDMVRSIDAALSEFAADADVATVVVMGEESAASAPVAISARCTRAGVPARRWRKTSGATSFISITASPSIPNPMSR